MSRPPDDKRSLWDLGWDVNASPRRAKPESRPLRVARTVRDMFTRGPRHRPGGGGPDNRDGESGSPVPVTPVWLNSPPPPHATISGMERGMAGAPGGRDPRGPARGPEPYDDPRGQAGAPRGGDRDMSPPLSHDPNVAPPRWQPPEWLPPTPPGASSHQMTNDFGQANREFDDAQGGYGSPYDGSYDLGADRGDSLSYGGGSSSYGRQAPEYVPPLTAKTPASPSASPNWSPPPTGQYDYSANASQYSAPSGGERLPSSDVARGPASLAHAGVSSSAVKPGEYVPGGLEPPAWAAPAEPARNPSAGPAPYYWEQAARAPRATIVGRAARLAVTALLVFTALFSFAYAGISAYSAYTLIYAPPVVATTTPAKYGLAYKEVLFTSRTDHVGLQGWFIPGVGANGALTDARTIIVVHGTRTNRADTGAGVLDLSAALAKHGFAVLAFDMRGMGASQPAPLSLGQYEQRDVLGAVDFLRTGDAPYPNLGRPAFIGGWGVSMGAATMLMAAAQEPAIRAVVSDSAYSDILPILQREIPKRSGLPEWFTPGVLKAVQTMYSIDFSKVRPVDVVAKVAPRPILFIQGADDTYVPDGDLTALAQAAQQGSGAQIQTWLVPGAKHAQAYHVAGQAYVDKVVAFFAANLR